MDLLHHLEVFPVKGIRSLTPALRQRYIPVLIPIGAMSRSIIDVWLILSKHFSISSSRIRFSLPLLIERRLLNRTF